MARALFFSIAAHLMVGVLAWLEFDWNPPLSPEIHAVTVSLAQLSQPMPAPKLAAKPKPKPAPKPPPKKTVKAPPNFILNALDQAKPPPTETVKAPPNFILNALDQAKPPPTETVKAPPRRTPKTADASTEKELSSLLNTLIKEAPSGKTTKVVEATKLKDDDIDNLLDVLANNTAPAATGLSNDDFRRLRAQLAQCWNIPSGSVAPEDLRIEISVELHPDGSILQASLLDESTQNGNLYYKTAAESALRALRHPLCAQLNLPAEKYTQWREIILVFDPREMF